MVGCCDGFLQISALLKYGFHSNAIPDVQSHAQATWLPSAGLNQPSLFEINFSKTVNLVRRVRRNYGRAVPRNGYLSS